MSENQNGRIDELSKYDTMTTEELEEILRLDVDAPEGQESDTETLLYVMEVLVKRKRSTGHTENTAQAYESFKKNYLPEVEEKVNALETKKSVRKQPLRWLRSLSAVAAVLVIILLGSITAKALGFDLWETVVKWTQETFHFGDGGQNDDGPDTAGKLEYSSLQEALRKNDINELLAPTWIPEGYHLIDITIQATPMQDKYNALYQKEDKYLRITVCDYLNTAPEYVEQSDDFVEVYAASGVEYYLFSNYERVRAAWINGSYECNIIGELTIEEMKLMIDSIKKG